MLLLAPDRVVSVDSLMEAVWQGQPPVTGRTQIAICVTALRKRFREAGYDGDVVVSIPPGYLLRRGPHRVDATVFAERVAEARAAAQQDRAEEAVEMLTDALDMWRGPALAGITGYPVEMEAARLEEERLTACEQLAGLRLELGQHCSLVGELAALVRRNPLRETVRRHLMLAQYRAGQRAEALETFRDGRRLYVEEFGLEPGPALCELHDAILHDSPDLAVPAATRLSTRARTERLIVPAQLPSDVPGFVGRVTALAALDRLIDDGRSAGPLPVGLVTGGVGVGKTGLAVHWAHRVAGAFPDGQLFVDLEGWDDQTSADPGAVLGGFLRALGVAGERIPSASGERAALYRSVVDGRRMLIVLDDASSYAQIAPLLPGSGSCAVLVTGQGHLGELLNHHCATRVRLSALSAEEAVELLGRVVGAARVDADLAGAARLAELCDRLPLALRIAGARLIARPHWTIGHLVDLLSGPDRLDLLRQGNRDIRARLLASYRKLDDGAAMLFRLLGTRDPDQELSGVACAILLGTSRAETEYRLESLVDSELVEAIERVHDPISVRYRIHGLLRLFAQELAVAELAAPITDGDFAA
jgi:DNA-binding SARP family transcriptional activator